MDTTSTIVPAAVESGINAPDKTLLRELDRIRRFEAHCAALTAFLREHHAALQGVYWTVWPFDGEIQINPTLSYGVALEDIARRFPGEWSRNVRSLVRDTHTDWVAVRGGVTVRIERAEPIIPAPPQPVVVTF